VITLFAVSPRRAKALVERGVVVYRTQWIFLASGFAEPLFYLVSIRLGISHLVGTVTLGGRPIPYEKFVAPGLLATSAMNGAVFDATFAFFYKLKIAKTYESVVATPLGVVDVAFGEVAWALIRGTIYSSGFLGVMSAFGLVSTPWAILALPAAMLVACCFAAIGVAASSFMRTWQDLSAVALALLPLFLFSGTFYAISAYPRPIALIVEATPLYQGVVLCRGLVNGVVDPSMIWHGAYLVVLAIAGLVLATRRLGRVLTP
jgi:lipooligosaccharide transport system permease protein